MTRFNGSILGSVRGSNNTSASGVWSINNVGVARLSDAWPIITAGPSFGYTSGGQTASGGTNVIDKFSFSSDGNASDVGDLSVSRRLGLAGSSSAGFGYTSGGQTATTTTLLNTIDRFPFAVDTNATDVGDLSALRRALAGQNSETNGYTSGGYTAAPGLVRVATIDKFPFATNTNATNIGSITQGRYGPAGQSSTVSGYTSGGNAPTGSNVNTIDKFPFATDANATDVGDLTQSRRLLAGQSSTSSGYSSGGGVSALNTIDKFPFSTDSNASDVGDLTQSRYGVAGQSSSSSGYTSGGVPAVNTIDKFPFSTNANATDVGDLTAGRYGAAGQQG